MNRKIRGLLIFGFLITAGAPIVLSQTDGAPELYSQRPPMAQSQIEAFEEIAQKAESMRLWAPIPGWAYGYDSQPQPGDMPSVPSPGNRALQYGEDAEELARPLRLEGSNATFSRQDIRHAQDVIDWFPEDYPPMADIIKYGPESLREEPDWACGSCHLPNGKAVSYTL